MADNTFSLSTQLSLNDEVFKKAIAGVKTNIKDLVNGVKTASGNVKEFNQALNQLKNVSFAGKTNQEITAVNTRIKELTGNLATLKKEQGSSTSGGGLGGLMPAIGIGAIIAGITSFGSTAVKAADEATKANKNLLFSVNGNTKAYNELYTQAEALRGSTGIDDESIKQIQQLAAGAGYSTDRIKKLTTASIELSKKTGIDLQAAYMALNKTLSGTVAKNLTGLDPMFKSLTKEQLKNGAAIDYINKQYGGFAANSVTNLDRAGVAWTEFQKGVGSAVSPLTNEFYGLKTQLLEIITPQKKLSDGMKEQALSSSVLIDSILSLKNSDAQRGIEIKKLIAMNPEYLSGLDATKLTQTDLLGIQKQLNKEFEKGIQLQINAEKIADVEKRKAANLKDLAAYDAAIRTKYMQQTGVKSTAGFNVAQLASSMPNQAGDVGMYRSGNGEAPSLMLDKYNRILKAINGNLAEEGDIKKDTDIIDAKQKEYLEGLKKTELVEEKALKNARGKLEHEKAATALQITRNLINANSDKPNPNAGAGSGTGKEINAKAKAATDYAKLTLDFNKKIAADEFEKKQAEAALYILTETSNAKSAKLTNDELEKRLALINLIGARMAAFPTVMKPKAAGVIGATATDQFGNVTLDNAGNLTKLVKQGLSAPMKQATKDAKDFGRTMNKVAGMTNDSISSIADSFGNLSSLFGQQTAAYKAFADAQAIIATFMAASLIMANTAKLGPAAMVLAMTSTIAMGLANVAKINGVQFASGGIVGGNSYTGDRVHAFVNSGELILNSGQQANLFSMLNSGGGNSTTGGQVEFIIKGSNLAGVLDNHSRRNNKIR